MKQLLILLFLSFVTYGMGQRDTLHVYYALSSTKISDTSEAKIDKWVASLKGQPVKIKVFAYYSKNEYEKFAQERADEMFLILNRKARALLTIESIGPKKGKNSQRSTVDIVYDAPGGSPATAQQKSDAAMPVTRPETARKEVREADKPADRKETKKEKAGQAPAGDEKKSTAKTESMPEKPAAQKPSAESSRPAPRAVSQSPDLEVYTQSKDEDFKSKTVVIALPGEQGSEYEKARKKGDPALSDYMKFARSFEESARRTFSQRWKYSKVMFVPVADAQKMTKESDKIVVLYTKKENGVLPVLNFDVKSPITENSFRVTLHGANPDESDFIMLQHKLARLYNVRGEFDREQLSKTLAARKLYIGRDQLGISQDEISGSYSYPFTVVDDAQLANVIADGEAGTMYLKAETVKGGIHMALVDGPTGLVLARAPAPKGKINAATLKDLVNETRQLAEYMPLTVY